MWAKSGECENNPGYMAGTCRLACNLCKNDSSRHLGNFRQAFWEEQYTKV